MGDTSYKESAKTSRSTAPSTLSPSLRETGMEPVCTPTFPPRPCAKKVDSRKSSKPSTSLEKSTPNILPFTVKETSFVLQESSRPLAWTISLSELPTVELPSVSDVKPKWKERDTSRIVDHLPTLTLISSPERSCPPSWDLRPLKSPL